MEYLVGLVLALIGGLFYFKNKANKAEVETKLANTKGRDRELAEQQAFVEQALLDLEEGIAKLQEEKKAKDNQYKYKTLKERADEARNRYKK